MNPANKMAVFFKYCTYIVGIFFLYSLFSIAQLQQNYTRKMPQKEQIEARRIVPVKLNYNKVVYLTDLEKRELNKRYSLFFIACFLALLVIIIQQTTSKYHARPRP